MNIVTEVQNKVNAITGGSTKFTLGHYIENENKVIFFIREIGIHTQNCEDIFMKLVHENGYRYTYNKENNNLTVISVPVTVAPPSSLERRMTPKTALKSVSVFGNPKASYTYLINKYYNEDNYKKVVELCEFYQNNIGNDLSENDMRIYHEAMMRLQNY